MKTIKILLVVVVILAIAGYFLPQTYKASREQVIRAPVMAVQKHVADMENWMRWAVWDEAIPPAGKRPAQMESGTGSGLYLSGNEGSGWFVVTDDSGIDGFAYVVFSSSGDKSIANVTFTDQGGETKVRWTVAGSVSRPPLLAPYLAMSKEFLVGSSLSQNLKNLKKLVEQEDR
ncbi:MAG: SRPBCC family protein [Arenicellales bacterium]